MELQREFAVGLSHIVDAGVGGQVEVGVVVVLHVRLDHVGGQGCFIVLMVIASSLGGGNVGVGVGVRREMMSKSLSKVVEICGWNGEIAMFLSWLSCCKVRLRLRLPRAGDVVRAEPQMIPAFMHATT